MGGGAKSSPPGGPSSSSRCGPQRFGPDLVAPQPEVNAVGLEDARQRPAVRARHLRCQIEKAHPRAGHLLQQRVRFANHGREFRPVRSRENPHQQDSGFGRLFSHRFQNRPDAGHDLRRTVSAQIVGSGQQHDDLRADAVHFPVADAPENALRRVAAPAEVGGVPAEKGLPPVLEQARIVERAPAPRDRIAEQVHVDAALPGLFEQLRVRLQRVGVQPRHRRVGGQRRQRRNLPAKLLRGPREEIFPVGAVRVAAVMLPPGELAIEQAGIHGRHLRAAVVRAGSQVARAQQAPGRPGRDGGHEAALLVEPLRIAFFRNSVTDKDRPRSAEGQQLMGVYRQISGVFAAEFRLRSGILQKIPRHPVIFALAGEIFDRLAEIPTERLDAPGPGAADESHGEARVEGHRDQGRLAEAGDAFDADAFRINCRVRFEEIQRARGAPGPGAERAPVVRPAGPPAVGQPDDAPHKPGAIVGLNAGRVQQRVAPARADQLDRGRRVRARQRGELRKRGRHRIRRKGGTAEQDHQRHWLLHPGGRYDHHLDLHLDVRAVAVVGAAAHFARDNRKRTGAVFGGADHAPFDLRRVRGHAPVDFALEILDDLRPAHLPPRLRVPHRPPVPCPHQLRIIREGVGLRLVVVGRVGRVLLRTDAGPQPPYAELTHHVLVILGSGPLDSGGLLPAGCRNRAKRQPEQCREHGLTDAHGSFLARPAAPREQAPAGPPPCYQGIRPAGHGRRPAARWRRSGNRQSAFPSADSPRPPTGQPERIPAIRWRKHRRSGAVDLFRAGRGRRRLPRSPHCALHACGDAGEALPEAPRICSGRVVDRSRGLRAERAVAAPDHAAGYEEAHGEKRGDHVQPCQIRPLDGEPEVTKTPPTFPSPYSGPSTRPMRSRKAFVAADCVCQWTGVPTRMPSARRISSSFTSAARRSCTTTPSTRAAPRRPPRPAWPYCPFQNGRR